MPGPPPRAIEEFRRRIPDYAITLGDHVGYTNYGVRAAVRLPVTFPVHPDHN